VVVESLISPQGEMSGDFVPVGFPARGARRPGAAVTQAGMIAGMNRL